MIEKTKAVEIPKKFIDVLFLTKNEGSSNELKKFFKQKKLTFFSLGIDSFSKILYHLDYVGAVVIDTMDIDEKMQMNLAQILEVLEAKKIGTVLLNNKIESPIHSFLPAAVKSFSIADTIHSISMDELWFKVSTILAYRKSANGIIAKTAIPLSMFETSRKNTLAQQISMAESLFGTLSEQFRMAGYVQRDFLPSQLPDTDKLKWKVLFQPAEWVSGDIYDVVRIDETHFGFYIADVVGHGMPAALLTIFLKQSMVLRETTGKSYNIFSPKQVISNLNNKMTGQRLSGHQFATCCYCIVDTKTFEMTYARGGHPYPVLIRDGQIQQLDTRGSLLGIFENADFSESKVSLQQGDKVIIYSDGVEHFIRKTDDNNVPQFSEDFLEVVKLPIDELIDKLAKEVKHIDLTSPELDDITVVGFEVK